MKKIKIICVSVVAAIVLISSLLNAFWPDRPTISTRENRTLAKFPHFSFRSLSDGSFFSGIDEFISDNFIGRDFLVDVSHKTSDLHGLSAFLPEHEDEVVFIPSKTAQALTAGEDNSNDTPENENPVSDNEEPTVNEETHTSEMPEEEHSAEETQTSEEIQIEPQPTEPAIEDPAATDPPDSLNDKAEQDVNRPASQSGETDAENNTPAEQTEGSPDTFESETQQQETPQQQEPTSQETEPQPEQTQPAPAAPAASPAPTENTPKTVNTGGNDEKAEFLSDGYIIYHNAVHSIPYLVKSTAEKYGAAINHYAELFPNSRITILVAPLSSGMIDNESIRKKITDQNSMINTINSYCGDNINKLNIYPALFEHRNEYIYYRSDHHWTARGAYYAYAEYAKSVGLEPTPIEKMEEKLLNSSWRGSAYSMIKDERVKKFSDELYAYMPTKANDMTVYEASGNVVKYNGCIRTSWRGYPAFITGDNPYTIINVPENPADMTVLVLKDSYGCAFVPFLCEHYRTIIVADPRYVNFDLYDLLKDYPLKDIIFMTNIFNPNVASWVRNINRIVGN